MAKKRGTDKVTTMRAGEAAPARTAQLPKALAKRAAALSAGKRARLARRGAELVTLVKRRRQEIADAFYDIGEALQELRARDMLAALGVRTFAELCDTKLGISAALGQQLVEVVERMTREEAISMGQSKAIAMVALAEATPEADTPGELYRRGSVSVPGAGRIDTKKASVRRIDRAARALRDAHDRGKPRRGRTTTAEERSFAAMLAKKLHAADVRSATVEAVATKPGQPSALRIAHVPITRATLAAAAKALAAAAKEAPGS